MAHLRHRITVFTTKKDESKSKSKSKESESDNLELEWLHRHLDLSERVLALLDAQQETIVGDEVSRQKRDQGKILEFDSLMSELYNSQNNDMQVPFPSTPTSASTPLSPTATPLPLPLPVPCALSPTPTMPLLSSQCPFYNLPLIPPLLGT